MGVNRGAVSSTDTPSGEGNSMDFDGNAFILVQDNIIPSGTAFSVNFWFKTGRNDQFIIGSNVAGNGFKECSIKFTETSCFFYHAGDKAYTSWSDLQWTSNSIASYVNNQWHMLTFTYDGNLAMLYIDGTLFQTVTSASSKLTWGSDVNACYFGVNNNEGFYNGKLDNFRSYNRAITATEVQTLFNAKQ